jgi:leucyl/phenylalanyl-tRNA--protein transferase
MDRSSGSRPIRAGFCRSMPFHVPHALERVVRKGVFEIRINVSFAEVMRLCAERPETWINDEIIASYTRPA